MLEQQLGQRIVRRELLQHVLVGRGLPGRGLLDHRQLHAIEQDLAKLLRRAQIERLTRNLMGLLLQCEDPFAEFTTLRREQRAIEQYTFALHAKQHFARRHLDPGIHEVELRIGGNPWLEHVMQLQRDIRIFGRVLGRTVDRDLLEADLARALPRRRRRR